VVLMGWGYKFLMHGRIAYFNAIQRSRRLFKKECSNESDSMIEYESVTEYRRTGVLGKKNDTAKKYNDC
jgi:hypothetical protein